MPTLLTRQSTVRTDPFRQLYQSSRWHRYSALFLKKNRLCVYCLSEGRTTVARVTDHIIPITQGGEIWNPSNHQPLCFKHHNQKTKSENK